MQSHTELNANNHEYETNSHAPSTQTVEKKKGIAKKDISDKLLHAALYKEPDIIRELHTSGLLDKKDGEKALYYAAKFNSVTVAKALIECGISPSCYIETNSAISELSTPLGIAVEHGSESVVELLLSLGVNVDDYTHITRFQNDCTPLRQAIIHIGWEDKPNPKIVSMLLSHGANVNKINQRGLSCLADHGDADELDLLLKAGLSPNIDAEGKSLLSRCISNGSAKLAVKLINYGANVFYVNNEGQTYLHKSHNALLTKALLDKGLDVNAMDGKGRTPVECCIDKDSVEMLVAAGGSINKLSMHHSTVLSSIFLTKKLIDANQANFSAVDSEGKTPLRKLAGSACLDDYLKTLEYILNNVPALNVNQAGPFGGWTALHEAFANNKGFVNFYDDAIEDKNVAESKYTKAIDLLIAHGAQPLKDTLGRTPLMCLTFSGFSSSYNKRVVERYFRFEAEYYGIEPEIYKKELCSLRRSGFQAVQTPSILDFFGCVVSVPQSKALNKFWNKMEATRNPAQKPNPM